MLVETYTIFKEEYLKEHNQYGLRSHICNHLLRKWSLSERNLSWHVMLCLYPSMIRWGNFGSVRPCCFSIFSMLLMTYHPPKRSQQSSLGILRGIWCVQKVSSSLPQIFFRSTQHIKQKISGMRAAGGKEVNQVQLTFSSADTSGFT